MMCSPDAAWTLDGLARRLAGHELTSEALTAATLDRIAAAGGDGGHAFTRVYGESALRAARHSDRRRAHGAARHPLDGVPVSIKDLFDVAGESTLAGSRVLAGAAPAVADAPVVAALRAVGAVIVGKTNMTEFAYSGLGLNPHFGTPANAHDPGRIPGGSSSGAAVAVAKAYAAASLGTDTGGSVRIPAAFNGVVGFKPTQATLPRDGLMPLATSLDTVGALAASVRCCALVHTALIGVAAPNLYERPLAGLRLAAPPSPLCEDLDPQTAQRLEAALRRLSRAGAVVSRRPLAALDLAVEVGRDGALIAVEAYSVHRELLAQRGALYDPRVRARLELAAETFVSDYLARLRLRRRAMTAYDRAAEAFDVLVCPTVPIIAPRFEELADDTAYRETNRLVLRNTSLFNILDLPAISLPCEASGDQPVGLMLVGKRHADRELLEIACAVEHAFKT